MTSDRRGFIKSAAAALIFSGFQGRAWAKGALPAPDSPAFADWLRAEARSLFAKNRIESVIGVFHVPSIETYRSFFAWDSGWNVISLMRLDPALALAELETIFRVQADDGHVPHAVRVPELKEREPLRMALIHLVRRQYDEQGRSHFIDPPSFLVAAGRLYEQSRDPRVLALLPAMEHCARYLTEDRDLFGDGLVSIIHPWESGTDTAPVFDEPMGVSMREPGAPFKTLSRYVKLLNFAAEQGWDLGRLAAADRFVFEDAGMNSITAAGLLALSGLFEEAGEPARAAKWRSRAESMIAAMEELLWDEGAGFFYPRYGLNSPRLSRRRCLTGALPLLTGLVSEDKAHRVLEGALKSAGHFLGPWLVPFNSISELAGERIALEEFMLWRGHCIWMNMNWMAARSAEAYGDRAHARAIMQSSLELIAASGFREFYDPRTGAGGGAGGFTWPALALDMIERYGG